MGRSVGWFDWPGSYVGWDDRPRGVPLLGWWSGVTGGEYAMSLLEGAWVAMVFSYYALICSLVPGWVVFYLAREAFFYPPVHEVVESLDVVLDYEVFY